MRGNTTRLTVEFDAVIKDEDASIIFTRVIEWHRELYGSDADGNRGVMMNMLDRDDAEGIAISFDNGKSYMAQKGLPADTQEAVEAAVQHYIDEHEPEPDDGPDPDDYLEEEDE